MNFSMFNLALINNKNTIYYPAIFGSEKTAFTEIKSGDEVIGEIPFSVDNVKDRFWLTFYDDKSKKVIAKFSLNNAYKKISNKSKKHNEKFFKKRQDFYTDKLPFYMEK